MIPTPNDVPREYRGVVDLEHAYDSLLNASLALSPVVKRDRDEEWTEEVKALNLATDLVAFCLGKNSPFDLTCDDVIALSQTISERGK